MKERRTKCKKGDAPANKARCMKNMGVVTRVVAEGKSDQENELAASWPAQDYIARAKEREAYGLDGHEAAVAEGG